MKNINKTELGVIITIQALVWAGMSLLTPIIPLYFTSMGISPSLVGGMIAVSWAGMIFGETFGGVLADRIGIKVPFIIATFLCVPLVILLVFDRNVPQLFLICFFWGVARSAVFGPARGYVANASSLSQKTTLMGISLAIEAFAGGLAALASGFIADHLGYHWDFYVVAGLAFFTGILVIGGLPKIRFFKSDNNLSDYKADPVNENEPPVKKETNNFQGSFILQCSVTAFCWWGSGIISFLPLLAIGIPGIEATQVGILFTVIGFVQAILLIPMGRLADNKGKTIFMMIGLVLLVADFSGLVFIKNFPLLVLFSLIFSLSMAMFSPAAIALISDTAPVYWQNSAMGIYGAAEDAGFILGSGLGGVAWSAWGSFSFLLAGISSSLGAAILGAFIRGRAIKKDNLAYMPKIRNDV